MAQDMPIRVEVEGVGVVEFPAGTSPGEIAKTLQNARASVSKTERTWGDTLADVGIGIAKGLGEGVVQAGKAIHAIPGVSRAVDTLYGQPGLSRAAMNEADTAMDATNTPQGVGKFAEQVGETLLAGPAIMRAGSALAARAVPYLGAKAAGVLPRVATEAAAGGALSAYQGGDATTGAVLGGAMPAVGAAVRAGRNAVLGGVQHTPEMARAVEFGAREGVPLDAATATGRNVVGTVQKAVSDSMGGAGIAERFQERQAEALARVGRKLAAVGTDVVSTPETAGGAVRESIEGRIRAQGRSADEAYGRVRRAERGAQPDDVPVSRPVAAGRTVDQGFIGHWLADDLNEMGYQAGGGSKKFYDAAEQNWRPGDADAARYGIGAGSGRVAGTPTLEMFQKAGISGSRAEIADRIRRVLRGDSNDPKVLGVIDAMNEAWDGQRFDFQLVTDDTLARTGLKRRDFKSPITLPAEDAPGAAKFFGDNAEGMRASGTEPMQFAVPLTSAKEALRPIYERLMRKKELTGQLMGDEGRAAVALDALISGPDHAPLSVVDAALGDLKAAARGAAMPELRTSGQGLAAESVKQLETLVQERAKAAGVWDDLRAGRDATIAKWTAAETLDKLRAEPVQTFKLLTSGGDAAIEKLREVKALAPAEMPKIGRAYVDQLLDTATGEGGFQRAQGLMAQWKKLGPETKALLFPNPMHRQDLDSFFLLAKKIGENPNPSGTARVMAAFNVLSMVPSYLLARVLYSPAGVRQLTKGVLAGDPSAVTAALGRVTATQAAQ